MQYMVIAYDGTDPEAPDRRQAVRPAHLDGVRELKAAGNLIAGGAILNETGEMIGSTLYVEFETREELNEWLNRDPYVSGGVWQDITVTPIRLANLD